MIAPQYDVALADFAEGLTSWRTWGRLGWQEIKRRYRRTVIGPFWTSLSLGVFVFALGFIWANLWKQDPKAYLPFLCSGMVVWLMIGAIITEGCTLFTATETFIKQFRFPYSILACSVAWRNVVIFLHNFAVYVAIALYAGVPVTPASLLVIPGLVVIWLNGVWVATLLGLACARYRDIKQVMTSVLQIAMFITPIFWMPEQLGTRFVMFVDYNFLYHYVDIVRAPLLGKAPAAWSWTVVAFCSAFGWTLTYWTYSRFRRRIAYWL